MAIRTRAERRASRDRYRQKTVRMIQSWQWPEATRDSVNMAKLVQHFEKNRAQCTCRCCTDEKYRDSRASENRKAEREIA